MTKFRNIAKPFSFSGIVGMGDIPGYVKQYIKDEDVLATYKTKRDYGVFTNHKIVLFDNDGNAKHIYTIPYKSISTPTVTFNKDKAKLNLYMDSSYPVSLKFINMSGNDKLCLRILYNCIDKLISGQEPNKEDLKKLRTNTIKF